ncbi:MAG: hypothetical protein FWF12_07680 [Betaproteobacteria bacterium]|nr:hypothetical protein [Betaproteobacteria bacterium]
MTSRGILLFLALAATLAAVYFAPATENVVVDAVVRPAAADSTARVDNGVRVTAQAIALRSRDEADGGDPRLFSAQSWDPPPPLVQEEEPQVIAEVLPPQAPPAPVQLLGRYEEGGKTVMFALLNGDGIVLRPGENINAEWRVDSIEAGQVVLTYLPLEQKQSLPWTVNP